MIKEEEREKERMRSGTLTNGKERKEGREGREENKKEIEEEMIRKMRQR